MSDEFTTPFRRVGDPTLTDERRAELYRQVFGTVNGRMVLVDILARAGFGNVPFELGKPSEDGWFNSGLLQCAFDIFELAGGSPDLMARALVNDRLEAATGANADGN